jgi:(1->4)-alpha-D-glucan 1-alpha-D-glucosylmutase
MRVVDDQAMLVAVPRLIVGLTGGVERLPLGMEVWNDTALALSDSYGNSTFRNLFTGKSVQANGGLLLSSVFETYPVAVLIRE